MPTFPLFMLTSDARPELLHSVIGDQHQKKIGKCSERGLQCSIMLGSPTILSGHIRVRIYYRMKVDHANDIRPELFQPLADERMKFSILMLDRLLLVS